MIQFIAYHQALGLIVSIFTVIYILVCLVSTLGFSVSVTLISYTEITLALGCKLCRERSDGKGTRIVGRAKCQLIM